MYKLLLNMALIIILLLMISIGYMNIYTVNAESASYVYSSKYDIDDSTELAYIDNLLNWISNAANYGYHRVNAVFVNDTVSQSQIYSAAGTSYEIAHVFYIGHGDYYYDDDHFRAYITDNNGNEVWDDTIYSYTGSRHVHLVFLYSCYQGREIGDDYTECFSIWCWTVHGGQANAWLHTTTLSPNGYNNPDESNYVFIGWYGPAPFLHEDIQGYTDLGYRFTGNFFTKLYGYYTLAGSVNEALDYASIRATGVVFGLSILHNGFTYDGEETRIVIYGDGNYDSW